VVLQDGLGSNPTRNSPEVFDVGRDGQTIHFMKRHQRNHDVPPGAYGNIHQVCGIVHVGAR